MMRKWIHLLRNKLPLQRLSQARWFNRPVFWLVIVLAAFLAMPAMSDSVTRAGEVITAVTPSPAATASPQPGITPTPAGDATPEAVFPTSTALPPEFIANREQTNGIIMGTIILLLIVIIGTFIGIRNHARDNDF